MSSVREIESELLQELALDRPDFAGATLDPSPNFGTRRDGKTPAFLILHYTGLSTAEEAVQVLKSPDMEVSAHYLVHEDGRVVQMVSENARAWHAGKSFWKGETDINSASIGIEIVNPGNLENYPAFKDAQIDAVIRLSRDICERHAIKPENVLAHSDIAPARKTDPGHNFPWKQLHDAGVGHYIAPTPVRGGRFLARGEQGQPVEALQSMLALYGYEIAVTGVFDEGTETVIKAFQRHFRTQNVDGVADVSTIDTLYKLIFSLQNVTA